MKLKYIKAKNHIFRIIIYKKKTFFSSINLKSGVGERNIIYFSERGCEDEV